VTVTPSLVRRVTRSGSIVVLALLVAGCLTTRDVLVGRTWVLAQVHGTRPVAEASAAFAGDGSFIVRTGCNTVGGTYHLDGNRILLDTVHQTLVLCEGEAATQEAGVLAVIKNRPVYAIDTGSGQLRLTSDADQVLLFEPRSTEHAYNPRASEAAGWSRVGRATGRREESPSSPAQGGG
jgi:heat shock protein HslJ